MLEAPGITISRWKRFGHDRVYANAEAGGALAYIDIATGEFVAMSHSVSRDEIEPLLRAWLQADLAGAATPVTQQSASDDVRPVMPRRTRVRERASVPRADGAKDPLAWMADEYEDYATRTPGQQIAAEHDSIERSQRAHEVRAAGGRKAARLAGVDNFSAASPFGKGAEGERVVGEALSSLAERGYLVLHSIPLPGDRDIDHVLVGPGGIFVVNAKNHSGHRVKVSGYGLHIDGHQQNKYLTRATAQAKELHGRIEARSGERLSRPVTPCLVFVDPDDQVKFAFDGERIQGVLVTTSTKAFHDIAGLEPVLSEERVRALFDMMRRSTFWG